MFFVGISGDTCLSFNAHTGPQHSIVLQPYRKSYSKEMQILMLNKLGDCSHFELSVYSNLFSFYMERFLRTEWFSSEPVCNGYILPLDLIFFFKFFIYFIFVYVFIAKCTSYNSVISALEKIAPTKKKRKVFVVLSTRTDWNQQPEEY